MTSETHDRDVAFLIALTKAVDPLLPDSLSEDQYLRLALSSLDQGGVSVATQMEIARLIGMAI